MPKKDKNVKGYAGGGKARRAARKKARKERRKGLNQPVTGRSGRDHQMEIANITYEDFSGHYGGGGAVKSETEDQRSKRMEKEDANVRGYWGGGGVKIKPYNPGNRLRQVFKKERGYGQAQEGGTGLSGGGKVKKKK